MTATARANAGAAAPSDAGPDDHPEGSKRLLAIYRPLFVGEGRAIAVQAFIAFLGGMAEALLLVLVAKVAFAIGGDDQQLAEGLGPLNDLNLSIGTMLILAVVLAVARFAFQTLAGHLSAGLVARRVTVLREGTFSDYAAASWALQSSFDEAAVQDLLVRHVAKVANLLVSVCASVLVAVTLVTLLVSAFLIDPLSFFLVIITGGVLFVILRPMSVMAKRYAQVQLEAGRAYANSSLEAIGLSFEIRAFGVNDEVAHRLAEATEKEVRPIYVSQLLQRTVQATYQLFALGIVLFGLYAVWEFLDRPLASLGAIVVILVRSMNMASSVQSTYHTATETAPFASELMRQRARFRASAPQHGDGVAPAKSSLEFEDVTYRYADDAELALDGVSFHVRHGEAVGVIGPSGSGKSTLIQLVLRLREPTTGEYRIGGIPSVDIDDDAWFQQVAFVPQDCRMINDSVMENIRFYRPQIDDDAIIAAAKRAHVHDEIMAMPDGYQTQLGSRGGSLSGGQRQRVAIARALATSPQLLVLDEPTSALDMRSESLVHETLTELQGSVTMLIIAHRLSTLKTCDRIMVFGGGRLQSFGERDELEHGNDFYREAIALSKLRS
ncbi:MAG TPA: ABC transporter ATP-binding protein [Acidimicrobiales bacterium]|nr:ABC transporter ATP-binding protein [Acidimicrobiales bacterium]